MTPYSSGIASRFEVLPLVYSKRKNEQEVKMTSLPFLSILLLVWFTADVYSEKILDMLKGSTAVLRPDLVEAEVSSITWKHGDTLAADWYGRGVPFYRSFKDRSSLGTKTGELIIHDVKLEDGGVYTPEINRKTLTAIRLQVFSPVPKPSISQSCNSEQTECILTCRFDRTDEMGNIEVFWNLNNHEKRGSEIQITQGMKEETFICRLNNSVSSENSNELQNPFWTEDKSVGIHITTWIVVSLSVIMVFAAVLFICLKGRYMNSRVFREINETKLSKECEPTPLKDNRINSSFSRERIRTKLNKECEQTLLDVYQLVLDFFNKRNPAKPYEESDQTLLKDPKTQEPTENPDLASSSETKPDPDTKTDEEAENLNKDPSEEINHETGSGSSENDPPETDRAEPSSGSPDGNISTSEPS
ncbi:hypothetical protein OJAV_G00012830 [Oryzias javanicus]|uniref:Ig-like domain-containing protein n=1 Tax=Oryzias javanicus TaxID=123683 RepID=A0A3S2Q0E8_ORYJA|nr:hypothetical protein OJAV_G00012830 [Oryzias javanicus]